MNNQEIRHGSQSPPTVMPTHPGEMLLQEFLLPLRHDVFRANWRQSIQVLFSARDPEVVELRENVRGVTPSTALQTLKILRMTVT